MGLLGDVSHKLDVGFSQRTRRIISNLNRWFKLDAWFPHLPLALAIAALGFFHIAPQLFKMLGWSGFSVRIDDASRSFQNLNIRGVPQAAAGLFLIVMSIGLLLKSRLAWVITILVTTASLVIAILPQTGPVYPLLVLYNGLLLLALFLARHHFHNSSLTTATLFAITSTFLLMGYAVLGSYELGQGFSPPINDVITALYYCTITMSTVGYGDIAPVTPETRLFVISVVIFGITIFATSLSAIIVPMVNKRMQRLLQPKGVKMSRDNHYIIIGDTALSHNSYKELKARNQNVTFIMDHNRDDLSYDEDDIIIGDGSDLDVLRRADADKAKAILALEADDSENAFIILAAKELAGNAKTVAAVNDAKNFARVRMVKPDLIIAPQVLGGELLAMALSGEKIESESLLERLLHFQQ